MVFQVNGTTVLDMNRNFATSCFPKTVNGISLTGTGDLKYIRPGTVTDHVVGDYLACGHNSMVDAGYGTSVFAANTTHAGSAMAYNSTTNKPMSGYYGWSAANTTTVNVGGTWRVVCRGGHDTTYTPARKQTLLFCRIS